MIFEIVKFGKFWEFSKMQIFQNGNFGNFSNYKFFGFSKFQILEIVQIGKLTIFKEFFHFENQNLVKKLGWFFFLVIFKFGCSTCERSLIFKSETSAVLKFHC